MDTEHLDTLLDASAPAKRTIGADDIRAMMANAAEIARPVRARRRLKVGLGIGAALAVVLGGGGVAIASGLVSWPSGFENPDGVYAFTLPSGRECEVRLIINDPTSPQDPSADDTTTLAVQNSVASWLRDGALDLDLDLAASDAETAKILAQQEAVGMTVLIGADGWLTDAQSTSGRPTPDDARAFAVNRAVGAAMTAHLVSAGFPENTWSFSTDGGVKCAAE